MNWVYYIPYFCLMFLLFPCPYFIQVNLGYFFLILPEGRVFCGRFKLFRNGNLMGFLDVFIGSHQRKLTNDKNRNISKTQKLTKQEEK